MRGGALFPLAREVANRVAYGYKGKGILIHTLTEGNRMPLSNCTTAAPSRMAQVAQLACEASCGSQREQILPLLDSVKLKTLKKGRPQKRVKVLAAERDGAKRTQMRPGLLLADTGAKHRPAPRRGFEPIGSVMRPVPLRSKGQMALPSRL